jgi:undecaprenyl-diphosphatase
MFRSLLTRDAALRDWIVQWHAPWLDAVMWTLSAIGYVGGVWLLIALLMAVWSPRLRRAAFQLVLALLLTQLVVDHAIKPLIARPRPFSALQSARVVGHYRPPTFSFPSGHAAISFAAATVLTCALPRAGAIWFLLAALIAFSRVYIGVHYPLDITAGALIGCVVGVFVSGGRAWYSRGLSVAPHRVPR